MQAPTAGQAIEGLDSDLLYTELVKNEDLLRHVSGNEGYEKARELAEFMKILNRSAEQQLADVRMKVRIPKGLSVESYISRVYRSCTSCNEKEKC